MAFVGMQMLDNLYHHKPPSLDTDWSKDSFAPIPSFVDTGSALIDKSNVESFLQAKQSATGHRNRMREDYCVFGRLEAATARLAQISSAGPRQALHCAKGVQDDTRSESIHVKGRDGLQNAKAAVLLFF
jgi:hypothetical protein